MVFIHHSQRDGRLSQENARKVWGYVSRRSWQKKSKQIKITMWEPPRRFSDRGKSHPLSDLEEIAIPYSDLQRAYLAKKCLKHLKPPEVLAMLETTLLIVYESTMKSCVLADSGKYTAEQQLELHDSECQLEVLCSSIQCGADNLLNHNVSQAFASFELASRLLKRCLSDKSRSLFSKIEAVLVYAQSRNAHDVVQQFLKQIAALADTSFGPRHPISIWARNMLLMGVNSSLVEKLFAAEMNAASSTKYLSTYLSEHYTFQFKCEVLRAGYNLQEAEKKYWGLVHQGSLSEIEWPYHYQFLSVTMAQLYLDHQSFVDAALILSDAPAHLEEYISKGWVPTLPNSAPLSMLMIVWRLYVLGQALAGQNNHEVADASFRLAISAGLDYLDHDHPINIKAQKAYSNYLSGQNLKDEANEIERNIDLGLDVYKLTLSSDKTNA